MHQFAERLAVDEDHRRSGFAAASQPNSTHHDDAEGKPRSEVKAWGKKTPLGRGPMQRDHSDHGTQPSAIRAGRV